MKLIKTVRGLHLVVGLALAAAPAAIVSAAPPGREGLPPGLQKKDKLPPGWQKKTGAGEQTTATAVATNLPPETSSAKAPTTPAPVRPAVGAPATVPAVPPTTPTTPTTPVPPTTPTPPARPPLSKPST